MLVSHPFHSQTDTQLSRAVVAQNPKNILLMDVGEFCYLLNLGLWLTQQAFSEEQSEHADGEPNNFRCTSKHDPASQPNNVASFLEE